ncbi:transposase [Picosynechococcus sp. NKBG15041c]|uniref:transposase n=1 Tax=Picosynechococcus sp. NKBG15041c TaxID=1407650 RepID=UPI0004170023|nr:transposase [Picosynechococcus sp. NKBG15041c]
MGDQELHAGEFLDPQFQWVSRDSDVLLRVTCPQDGDFLLLNELQLRYDSSMPRRMTAYAALAREKFNLPVYPVLINILQPSQNPTIANCYQAQFKGLKARQDYQVINLWEVDTDIVFEQNFPSLLPFVPILKNGNGEQPIREAVRRLRQRNELDQLEPLSAFFASFVLEIPLVQQIMRWDMAVLQESPWYEEILKRGQILGLKEGIEQGIETGLQQGIELEKRRIIPRLLAKEFTVEEIAEIVGDSVEGVTQIIQMIQENQGRSPENINQD